MKRKNAVVAKTAFAVKKAGSIILFIIVLFCANTVYGQNTSPIDLILLLDTSTGMSSSYDNVNNYLLDTFLTEFLRVGDTFHFIPFSETPKLDAARRISGIGDVETIIARMLLQYPIENGNNVRAALAYAEEYLTSLPNRPKKIVLITCGSDTSNLAAASRTRLSSRNTTVDFIQVTAGQALTNLPRSGREQRTVNREQATPRPSATASPNTTTTPSAVATASTTTTPSTATTPRTSNPVTTPSAAATSSTTTTPSTTASTVTTPSATTTPSIATTPSTTTSPSTTASPSAATTSNTTTTPSTTATSSTTTTPSITVTQDTSSTTITVTTPSTVTSPSLETSSIVTSDTITQTSPSVSDSALTGISTTETTSSTTAASSEKQTNTSVTSQTSETSSRSTNSSSLPIIIGIIILVLLLLGLLIFLLSRRLRSSPNRVMSQASDSDAKLKDTSDIKTSQREVINYSTSPSRRTSPYDDKPTAADNSKSVVINPSGPLLLNLFVEDQNTNIGKRNIHSLKSGYSLTVGGGEADDYHIFLVPIPAHIGEIRRNGSQLTFIPKKEKYFPDIKANEVNDCINKTIRIISDKNYEMRFRFVMYEDPLIALNRLLNSVRLPG